MQSKRSATPPVHVPEDVAAYFRAGGRIKRVTYCDEHGYTRHALLTGGGGCVECEFKRRNREGRS